MTEQLLQGGRVLVDHDWHRHDVRVRAGRIASIGPQLPVGDAEVIDVRDQLVVPGLLELQVNGVAGADLTSSPECLWEVGTRLAEQGVTAFLPTLVSCPPAVVDRAREVLLAGPPPRWRGAVPLGWHVEGPMLAPTRRGAHDPAMLRAPTLELVAGWSRATGIAMVTLAPELPGATEVVAALATAGVVVAAGHTDASAAQVRAAVDAGITFATHLFNAMPPISGRSPGPAAALLGDPRVRVGCIADGVHLAPATLQLVWEAAGPDRLVLVTDAMAATGLGDGTHRLGSQTVTVSGGRAALEDGTLAGSVATLDGCVRHLADVTSAAAAAVLRTATATPAAVLGDGDRGRLAIDVRADIVVLEADLRVAATMVAGELVHPAPGARCQEVVR